MCQSTTPGDIEGAPLSGCDGGLLELYAGCGGVVGGDEFAALLRARTEQPISEAARLVVSRRVVNFMSGSETVLPCFQFEGHDMRIREAVVRVLSELGPVLSDWEIARWFVTPNSLLDGVIPVGVVAVDPDSLCAVARVERFLAR